MFDCETKLRVGLKRKNITESMKLKYALTTIDNIYILIFQNDMIYKTTTIFFFEHQTTTIKRVKNRANFGRHVMVQLY